MFSILYSQRVTTCTSANVCERSTKIVSDGYEELDKAVAADRRSAATPIA